MASISTQTGDHGQTGLIGGIRVSKSHLRIEAGGTIDELNSVMGLARSFCDDAEVCQLLKTIQRELFIIGSSLATLPHSQKQASPITSDRVDALTAHVHRIEKIKGIVFDWILPGEHTTSATFDMARTVCRRAERCIVRLTESGEKIDSNILPYINRLSDMLWLIGRLVELRAGVKTTPSKTMHGINSTSP